MPGSLHPQNQQISISGVKILLCPQNPPDRLNPLLCFEPTYNVVSLILLALAKMIRKVIINADDFGLCEGVNKGIVKAHTEGLLTSAGMMANMPCADEAAAMARALSGLGIGVHLNLTDGRPLCQDGRNDCLLDSTGKFIFRPGQLSWRSLISAEVRNAIRAELQAQIQWVFDHGIKPTHFDSHKHIHCFPVIFRIVCALAKQYGVSAIRWPLERQSFQGGLWPTPGKKELAYSRIIRIMARINRYQNAAYFKTSDFIGIAHTGRISVAFLEAFSRYHSSSATEIMTHPGFREGLERVQTRLVEQREYELNALCSEQSKSSFRQAGIQLVHYGQLS
ncbi:MAG: ChbG/HpnK family deacetylase [Planctomycetes bacterium]|nr:ChbG/HpnK family deacetylase [Planctomycetota bacterium]